MWDLWLSPLCEICEPPPLCGIFVVEWAVSAMESESLPLRETVVEVISIDQHPQSGAIELLNRILIVKLYLTLLLAKLDPKWWTEVFHTLNYLCNLSPCSVINKYLTKYDIPKNPILPISVQLTILPLRKKRIPIRKTSRILRELYVSSSDMIVTKSMDC